MALAALGHQEEAERGAVRRSVCMIQKKYGSHDQISLLSCKYFHDVWTFGRRPRNNPIPVKYAEQAIRTTGRNSSDTYYVLAILELQRGNKEADKYDPQFD